MHINKEKKRDPKTVSTSVFKRVGGSSKRSVREERLEGRIQQAPCNNCAHIYKSRGEEVTLRGEDKAKVSWKKS